MRTEGPARILEAEADNPRAGSMSTTDRDRRISLPRLVEGETLDRATFHERYEAMPEDTRAELIGGVVHFMPSPLKSRHGEAGVMAILWLGYFAKFTRGVQVLENASVLLGEFGEPQPDVLLRILPAHGGRTRDELGYVVGAPEFLLEVSDSSLAKDLGPKLADYERAGLPESVVLAFDPPSVRWHVLRGGRLVEVAPDVDGLHHSETFPGLWLDPGALFSGDIDALWAAVDAGVATADHAAFVARLAEAARGGRA